MAVVVPIVADFDPAGIKSADAAFKSFGQNLSKVLGQASKSAAQSLDAVEDGANDARTAAQRLADAISASSASLQADIDKSAAAAKALGDALGPELTRKLGSRGLQNLIRDLSRMGLSLEQVTDEAETLAASIKGIDDASVNNITREVESLDDGLKKVGDSADRSRSVMANFTGNAVQEIPGITNAMGPLNVAIGQFAEYASEGGITLAGFAKAIGPLAAIGGALALANGYLDDIAKTKAFNKERLDAYTESMREGASAAQAFRTQLEETGKATLRLNDENAFFGLGSTQVRTVSTILGDLGGAFGIVASGINFLRRSKTEDVSDELLRLGVNAQIATELIGRGRDGINKWAASLLAAGAAERDVNLATRFLTGEVDRLAEAQQLANQTTLFLKGTLFDYGNVAATVAAYQDSLAEETQRSADQYQAQADAIAASRDELFKFLDVGRTERQNAKDTAEARNDLAIARKKGNSKDIISAEERYLQAIEDEAQYLGEAFVQTSKVRDEKLKQALATETVIRKLEAERDLLDPASPLRKNLDEYIRALRDDLPRDVRTRLILEYGTSGALPGMPGLPTLTAPNTGSAGGGGLGNVTINLSTLNPDEAAARAIAKSMNQAADRAGTARPFPWAGV